MSRRPRHARVAAPAAALAVLVAAGCADQFTVPVPESPPQLVGEITAMPAVLGRDCGPMRVELSILTDPITERIAGRAYPGEFLQPYWLEGDLYENGVALVTLFQSTTLPQGPPDSIGAKPFSVFRGTLVGDRLDLAEQPPSCGRRLVAEARP